MQLYRTLFIENRQTLLGNCSAGQLSSIGAQQTTSLGSSLRSGKYSFICTLYSLFINILSCIL